MDLLHLSYNDYTLFHMLRHFENIKEQARICLQKRGYTNIDIEENLEIPGSKFQEGFATDIKSLIEQFKIGKQIKIQERKKYQEIVLDFDENIFPNGIGTLGVCNRKELENLNASEPILKNNRGIDLWHVRVNQMPTTHQLTIVVKKQSASYFLITAFPGLPAMPIPKRKMNPVELELSKQYWEDKVFVEKVKFKIKK